jgi:hypothetical protein
MVKSKLIFKFFLVSWLLFPVLIVFAQEKPEESGLGEAASNATNPMAFVTKLQVQPNFTWKDGDATQINLTTRIIQPTGSIGLPFIKSKDPSKVYTLYRIELPIIGQTYPEQPEFDATGLSDVIILDLIAFKQKWGLLGVGPGIIIPTMQPKSISSGKWSAGVTGVVLNTKTKGLQFGVLFQQFFSVAGSSERPDKNFMLFQPIFNKVLRKGYFTGFSPIMTFDWENSTYNIPLTISFGKAFAKNLSAFVAPEYVVSGPNQGDFTFRFQLNAMFPPSKKTKSIQKNG